MFFFPAHFDFSALLNDTCVCFFGLCSVTIRNQASPILAALNAVKSRRQMVFINPLSNKLVNHKNLQPTCLQGRVVPLVVSGGCAVMLGTERFGSLYDEENTWKRLIWRREWWWWWFLGGEERYYFLSIVIANSLFRFLATNELYVWFPVLWQLQSYIPFRTSTLESTKP